MVLQSMKISNSIKIVVLAVILLGSSCIETSSPFSRPECPAIVVPCQQSQQQIQDKPTVLTFYIQSDVQQEQDFIEMTFTVKQKDVSLKKAIDKLNRKVDSIKKLCEEHCTKNQGEGCEDRVQINKFNVQPSYQVVRRQPIFNGFFVTNTIKVVVVQTQDIGALVDSLLELGIYQIQQIQWKPHNQLDSIQMAIDAGITKGNELCKHINRKMGTVLSIEQVFFEEEQDDNKQDDNDGNNDEQNQKQPQNSLLQFKIQCIGTQQKSQASGKKSKEVKQAKQSKEEQSKSEKKKKKK